MVAAAACAETRAHGDDAVAGEQGHGEDRAVADECQGTHRVEAGYELLGEQQIVDLTAVAGTYVTVAMVLAMAEEGVPPGKDLPFKVGEP